MGFRPAQPAQGGSSNLDGGTPSTNYVTGQIIDGGTP